MQTRAALGGVGTAGDRLASGLARVAKVGALALAAGLAVSVKSAIDFESSFAGVRKTVDATEPQFERLAKGIRDMATEIPASANELNKIAESAGQLGIRREAILGFTRTVADLGETTNLVGEQAASSLARISNIMRTPQRAFDRLGSTIVALGNAGASTESEIVEMGLRIAGAGQQAGLSEADVLGFANALSSVGIEAQAGGTAISKVMIEISKEVATGGERLEDFAEVAGMSSSEFKRAFEEDAAGAIVTFIEGLGKIGDEGGNVFQVIEDLGLSEQRLRDALLRASGAGDLLRDSLKTGSKAWEENNALTEEAQKRYETTAAKLEILRNNVVDIAISVGDVLIPAVAEGAERMAGLLRDVREADGLRAKVEIAFEGVKEEVGRVIRLILSEVDAHLAEIAEIGLKLGLTMLAKLFDPAFWRENWKLILGAAVAVFPLGRLVTLSGRVALALLSRVGRLLPAGFREIGFRASQTMLAILGRLPGLVQRIILALVSGAIRIIGRLVSYLRGAFANALGRVPFWLAAAFRLTAVLAFVNGARAAFDRVREAVRNMVDFASRQIDRMAGPFLRVIGWANRLRDIIGLVRSAIEALIGAINRIPTPRLPSIPNIPGIPGFAEGGIVPGRVGVPRLAVVHGGEEIIPPGRRGGAVVVQARIHFHGPVIGGGRTTRQLGKELANIIAGPLSEQIRIGVRPFG